MVTRMAEGRLDGRGDGQRADTEGEGCDDKWGFYPHSYVAQSCLYQISSDMQLSDLLNLHDIENESLGAGTR